MDSSQPLPSPQPEEHTASSDEGSLTLSIDELISETLDEAFTPNIDHLDSFDEAATPLTSQYCDETAATSANLEQYGSGYNEDPTLSTSQHFPYSGVDVSSSLGQQHSNYSAGASQKWNPEQLYEDSMDEAASTSMNQEQSANSSTRQHFGYPGGEASSTSILDQQQSNYGDDGSLRWSLEQLYESSFNEIASTSTNWKQQDMAIFAGAAFTPSMERQYRQSHDEPDSESNSPEKHYVDLSSVPTSPEKHYMSNYDEGPSTSMSPMKQYVNRYDQAGSTSATHQEQHSNYSDLAMSLKQLYIKSFATAFASMQDPNYINICDKGDTASLSLGQQCTDLGDETDYISSLGDAVFTSSPEQHIHSEGAAPSSSPQKQYAASCKDAASKSMSVEQQEYIDSFDEDIFTSSPEQQHQHSFNEAPASSISQKQFTNKCDEAASMPTSTTPTSLELQNTYRNNDVLSTSMSLESQQYSTDMKFDAVFTTRPEQLMNKFDPVPSLNPHKTHANNSDIAVSMPISSKQQYVESFKAITTPANPAHEKAHGGNEAVSSPLSTELQQYIRQYDEDVITTNLKQQENAKSYDGSANISASEQHTSSFNVSSSTFSPQKHYANKSDMTASMPKRYAISFEAITTPASREQQNAHDGNEAVFSPFSAELQQYLNKYDEAVITTNLKRQENAQSYDGSASTSTSDQHPSSFSLSSTLSPQKHANKSDMTAPMPQRYAVSFEAITTPASQDQQNAHDGNEAVFSPFSTELQQYINKYDEVVTSSSNQQHTHRYDGSASTSTLEQHTLCFDALPSPLSSQKQYADNSNKAASTPRSLRKDSVESMEATITRESLHQENVAVSSPFSMELQQYINNYDKAVTSGSKQQEQTHSYDGCASTLNLEHAHSFNASSSTLSPQKQFAKECDKDASMPTNFRQQRMENVGVPTTPTSPEQQNASGGDDALATSMSEEQQEYIDDFDEAIFSPSQGQRFSRSYDATPSTSSQNAQSIKPFDRTNTTSMGSTHVNYSPGTPTTSLAQNQQVINSSDAIASSSSSTQQFSNYGVEAPTTSMNLNQQFINTLDGNASTSNSAQQLTNSFAATVVIGPLAEFPNNCDGAATASLNLGQKFIQGCEEAASRSESMRRDGDAATSFSLGQRFVRSCERLYVCVQCGKECSSYYNFKTHVKNHSREKGVVCEVCDKSFFTKEHLKLHMRVHTGEKPFSCESCGKSFTVVSSLNRHRQTHLKFKTVLSGTKQ